MVTLFNVENVGSGRSVSQARGTCKKRSTIYKMNNKKLPQMLSCTAVVQQKLLLELDYRTANVLQYFSFIL